MHRMHNQPGMMPGPQTTGRTIHWAPHYDRLSRLLGLGVNQRGSRMVVALAEIRPGETVLDAACGTGNLTLTAQSVAGPSGKVYGIDASPEMIAVARKNAARTGLPVVFQVGLFEALDFPPATFDVIISRLAIHHLPDDLKPRAFAEVYRVLKPGGRLLIADFIPPSNPVLNHIASALVGGHMMQTDVWGLPRLLEDAGFVEVASGPTRSSFLAFVRGKKPGNQP